MAAAAAAAPSRSSSSRARSSTEAVYRLGMTPSLHWLATSSAVATHEARSAFLRRSASPPRQPPRTIVVTDASVTDRIHPATLRLGRILRWRYRRGDAIT